MGGWPAILASVTEEMLPEGAMEQLSAAGLSVSLLAPGALERQAAPEQLAILWAGTQWEAGLDSLRRIRSARARARTVVWGLSPASEAEQEIRRAGGLCAADVPFPAWLAAPALEALGRWDAVPTSDLAALLVQDLTRAPEETLRLLGREAAAQLGCSRWTVAVRGASGVLEQLALVPGGMRVRAGRPVEQAAVLEEALRTGELVLSVDVPARRRAMTTLALPIRAAPAPDGVLALSWGRAFLPNAREVERLRLLAAVGSTAWARMAAELRLNRAHVASLEALSALPWASPSSTDAAPLVERLLRAHLALPGVCELWARAGSSSREPPRWIGCAPDSAPTLSLREREAAHAETGGLPRRLGDGRWRVSLPLDGGGVLAAVLRAQADALAEQGALARLGADLALGLRLLRRSSDNNALIELSQVLAEAASAREALAQVAEIVCAQLDADGVVVYTVETEGAARVTSLLLETGQPTAAPCRCVLSHHHGLADRVIAQDDWLLVTSPPADGRVQARAAQSPGLTLTVRPDSDYWGTRTAPPARLAQLLVPLRREGVVVGVLGVWRERGAAFEPDLDLETMRHLAPHVTNACVRVHGMERLGRELLATQRLAAALSPDCRPVEGWHHLLAEVCTLTDWPRALLLLHDPQDRGQLFFAAAWPPPRAVLPWSAPFQDLQLQAGADADGWPATVEAALRGAGPTWAAVLGGGSGGSGPPPRGVVVLLGPEGGPVPGTSLTPQLDALALESFLRYAAVLLDNHLRAFAQGLAEQLQQDAPPIRTPAQVMDAAARRLHHALGAELVLVEERQGADTVVRVVVPADGGDRSAAQPALWPAEAGQGPPEPARVLDTRDAAAVAAAGLSAAGLAALRRQHGWSRVRSWLGTPIWHQGRCVGQIQVLTAEQGPYLGPDQALVVSTVAQWASVELGAALRRQMLEGLNTLAYQLAGETGEGLGRRAVAALEDWLERFLGRRCPVVLLAWTPPAHPLLTAYSTALSGEVVALLRELSLEWGPTSRRWSGGARLGAAGHRLERAGVACPLHLPGEPALRGHLVMLHRRPFSTEDASALKEAARELANLLHGELIQQEWRFQAGLFRHALLGPVQGLCSAALRMGMLAREAVTEDAPAAAEAARLHGRILEESEVIRLWRDTQRAFAMLRDGAPIDVRLREQPLRPLVERCLERYQPAFRARGIDARLEWPVAGPLRFAFDKVAVDLALSNLLDNARKYAFYNREIVVGAAVDGEAVLLWVEDVGAAVPTALGEAIYDLRKRTDRQDPIRAIHGEGLGLYIARAVALAHRGQLSHTARPEGRGDEHDPLAPHRVRFTLRLPHHWRKP